MDMIKTRIGRTLLVLSAASALAVLACGGGDGEGPTTETTTKATPTVATETTTQATPAPTPGKTVDEGPAAIDSGKKYTAFIVLEKSGEIPIELLVDSAPSTVSNFITLAREGYYDGVAFEHMSLMSMGQTADPEGFEPGGGLEWENELNPNLRHGPGIVSMDNSRAEVNRGQILISFALTKHLDTTHTIFGRVIGDGMDVARTITVRDPVSALVEPDAIKTIRIEEGQ